MTIPFLQPMRKINKEMKERKGQGQTKEKASLQKLSKVRNGIVYRGRVMSWLSA